MTTDKRIILAVTGASGMPYACTLAQTLSQTPGIDLSLIISDAARTVMQHEGEAPETLTKAAHTVYEADDFAAAPSSGSWQHQGMIVCPCSMASLGAIASGNGTNLIHRAADVTLKERRPLVLVTRETPLSRIHLENMLRAQSAGAVITPASPGFYNRPASVQDLVDHLCARILDQVGVPHTLSRRWAD